MRCIYCYNTQIVGSKGSISTEEFMEFLNSRIGKLEGVVFSGGECTLSREFLTILRGTKSLGFKSKIDTNGSNPKAIKTAIDENLVDFVALDFKAKRNNFKLITNSHFYSKFISTLQILLNSDVNFEVRTTVHSDFIDERDIEKMAEILVANGYRGDYFLQRFLDTGENFGCLNEPSASFDPSKIKSELNILLRNF